MENYKDLAKFSITLLALGCVILLTLCMGLELTKNSIKSITTILDVSLNLAPIQAAEEEDKREDYIYTSQPTNSLISERAILRLEPLNNLYSKDNPLGCNPSYPTMCLSMAIAKMNCEELRVGDMPYRNFKVLVPDSLGFDPDGNGIGCEVQ